MQIDSDDRYTNETRSAGLPIIRLALAVLALAGIGFWYFYGGAQENAAPSAELAPIAPAAPAKPAPPVFEPAPDIPEPPTVEPRTAPEPTNSPVPPAPGISMETSDPALRAQLAPVFTADVLAKTLEADDLIERGTALVDAASQGIVLPRLFPLPPPQGKFTVSAEGENFYTDPRSYQRYDTYAQAISALDPKLLADTFHTFRPLLEQAYAALGYKSEDLDNTLIRALDQVLSAPLLQHPALLEKEITTYKYADPSLEELSPLAKQLMRMGPENQALMQNQARAVRARLLAE